MFTRSSLYPLKTPLPYIIYLLSLHDALPISITTMVGPSCCCASKRTDRPSGDHEAPRNECHPGAWVLASSTTRSPRSEEHTTELQSPCNLVCRLLLEKKNNTTHTLISNHTNK